MVVEAFNLSVTLDNESSFVSLDGTVSFEFSFEDPFTYIGFFTREKRFKRPCGISL